MKKKDEGVFMGITPADYVPMPIKGADIGVRGKPIADAPIISQYQSGGFGEDAYGDDAFDIESPEITTKMIATLPPIGHKAKVGTVSPASRETSVQKQPRQTSDLMSTVQGAAGLVAQGVAEYSRANANLAQDEYSQDMADWQSRYWFDPSSDLKPDIEKYMSRMPSKTEALSKGTLSGGQLSDSSGGQAGLAIGTLGISELMGDKKQAEYIWNKGGEGALSGSSVGWIGTIAGAAVGVIEGIFSWNGAVEVDKKNKAKALAQYEDDLRKWTFARNDRIIKENKELLARQKLERIENREKDEAKKKSDTAQRARNIVDRKDAIFKTLTTAGAFSRVARAQRAERWR